MIPVFSSQEEKEKALEEMFFMFFQDPSQFGQLYQGDNSIATILEPYGFPPKLTNLLSMVAGDFTPESKIKWWTDFLEMIPINFDIELFEYRISEFRMVRLLCLVNGSKSQINNYRVEDMLKRSLEESYRFFSNPNKRYEKKPQVMKQLSGVYETINRILKEQAKISREDDPFYDISLSALSCLVEHEYNLLRASYLESKASNAEIKSTQQLLLITTHFYKEMNAIEEACQELF